MSYILEALKKSEDDRGQTGTPTFQTVHHSSLQYQSNRQNLWPYILTAVVVLNIMVLTYLVYDSSKQAPVVVQAPAAQPVVQPAPVTPQPVEVVQAAPVIVAPVRNEPVIAQAPVYQPPVYQPVVVSEPEPVYTPAPTNRQDAIAAMDVNELPLEIQTSIPDMTFSAHVYSSNPTQRSVVINDNFMEEGDLLTSQLRLVEITNDGVVFDYQGTRFRSSVVSGWSIN